MSPAIAKLRARKAAALGMTLEQFDAHCQREQAKLDAYHRCSDREWSRSVIAAGAARRANTWAVVP